MNIFRFLFPKKQKQAESAQTTVRSADTGGLGSTSHDTSTFTGGNVMGIATAAAVATTMHNSDAGQTSPADFQSEPSNSDSTSTTGGGYDSGWDSDSSDSGGDSGGGGWD